MDHETACWIATSRLPGLAGRHVLALERHFGSLAAAWQADMLAWALALGGKGAVQRPPDPWDLAAAVMRPEQEVVVARDPRFPAPLRTIPDPPAVLYVRGRLPAHWDRAVAIVGTRRASSYGARVARQLGHGLAREGALVVSGAAAGIDASAHEGALAAAGGQTVAVLGCGLDHVYPAGHGRLYAAIARHGALVSEHPPEEGPTRYGFPRRNRLISGLAAGVIVVEAGERSGSLITADFALEQGRSVMAVPGPIDAPGSAGPHALLRDGARLVAGLPDVYQELGWVAPAAVQPADPLLAALAAGPCTLDELAERLGLPAAALAPRLLALELEGKLLSLPGGRYAAGG